MLFVPLYLFSVSRVPTFIVAAGGEAAFPTHPGFMPMLFNDAIRQQ